MVLRHDSGDSDGPDEAGPNCDWQKYKVRSHANTGYNANSKRDIIDTFFTYVNRDLLICKLFYFFFFAAFGSLFPLLAIYFKQLGMNPTQSGILIGFRPFVEFCSAPFWGGLADRYKKGKQLLLFALFCWIVFTLSIAFVKPPPHHCVETNFTYNVPSGYVIRGKREATSNAQSFGAILFENTKLDSMSDASRYSHHSIHKREKEVPFSNEQNENNNEVTTKSIVSNVILTTAKIPVTDSVSKVSKGDKVPDEKFVPLKPTGATVTKGVSYNIVTQTSPLTSPKTTTMPIKTKAPPIGEPALEDDGQYIKPKYSTIYYEKAAVQDVFFTLLILIIIGEFFSAPALTFADSVTLAYLGEDTDNYGRQRMFGSLGWGLSMFFVGLALDQSTTFPDHPCGLQHLAEKNYILCFAVFSVLMSCALITATQLKFDQRHGGGKDFQLTEFVEKVKDTVIGTITGKKPLDRNNLFGRGNEDEDFDYLESKATMQKQMEAEQTANQPVTGNGTADGYNQPQLNGSEKNVQISLQNKDDMVSDVTRQDVNITGEGEEEDAFFGKWLAVLKMLATFKYISVLFVSWFMGFGIGLIFTFLFWHLQDLGGSPTLFGVASVCNHISELLAYFLSRKLILFAGHIKVLYAGLFCNVVRFLYISWLENPWWVLPFEFVQGLTHAAVWAASCSYITQAIPLGLRSSAQGILQGLHHGLGRGCGAVFGGIMVYSYGGRITFRAYGITSLIVLILYAAVTFFLRDRGKFSYGSKDTHAILQEEEEEDTTCHLAPHGVPSGMARDLSSSKLREEGYSNYGSTGYDNGQQYNQYDQGPQRVVMDIPPAAPTQVYQQQPYNHFDQQYGP